MVDMLMRFVGAVALLLLGGVLCGAVVKMYAISNDTRTMVVLLRRVLDLTTDYGTREREEATDVDG